ncbi:MAG: hypothetical protein J3Q66DRAFT_34922 [Benniella sp.]|nr:MAG: hypothetical protein J3Q66DRAFT_34922 [Benniella sp.]
MPANTTPELPLEIWFQILSQTLNLLLPMATTPRTYSTYIIPLLLTSRTFYDHCHPVTYPHLRKHRLLQLFTRWKAAHSREVHFYHHPLRNHVRYALPDRVGNPPGEEYETLYSFIKRAYLFGCESVCGTVIPVEGGLEAPIMAPSAPPAPAGQGQGQVHGNNGATATTNPSTPVSTTGPGSNGENVVVVPPPTQVAAPVVVHHGGEGGGQSWKSHALQWHVANPTFAAEGTIELYRDVVEDYRRVVCGTPAARERQRELERVMDMMKNPQRYSESQSTHSTPHTQQQQQQSEEEDTLEDETEDDMDDTADEDEYEQEMIEKDDHEFLTEIEAKGGLRRRDSGHGQSSSEEMDIDEDMDEEERHHHRRVMNNGSVEPVRTRAVKRESEPMPMDFQLEDSSCSSNGRSHYRNGLRPRKMERSCSANEQERLIMDMALDKPYHRHHHNHGQQPLSPVHPLESLDGFRRSSTCSLSSSSSASSSSSSSPALSPSSTSSAVSGLGLSRSGSPAPFTPLSPSSRRSGRDSNRPKSARTTLRRSYSSPSTTTARLYSRPPTSHGRSSLDHSLPNAASSQQHVQQSPLSRSSSSSTITHSQPQQPPQQQQQQQQQELQQQRPLRAEDLDFDLASACANTFASDLAFVLARVPGLGAHFHRFEQLSKLKLHVGWAKHAQSRGGNDVFVMSCSRLISLLAPLANTPLVSERGA